MVKENDDIHTWMFGFKVEMDGKKRIIYAPS